MRVHALVCGLVVALGVSGCLQDPVEDSDHVSRNVVEDVSCPVEDAVWSEVLLVDNLVGGPTGDTGHSFTLMPADHTDWTPEDADCVRAIRLAATWTNEANGGADLYLGVIVPGTDEEVLGHDEQQYVADGEHTESVFAPTAVDGFSGSALMEGVEMTLYTRWASLAQDGVAVNLTTTLVVP